MSNPIRSIGVQFSGNAKVYAYVMHPTEEVKIKDRVVVPVKLKDDGTLSLSIATVVEVHKTLSDDAEKPIIQVLSDVYLNHAERVLQQLAAEVPA